MMSILEAIFLGFVQGATEFLPISSSGHLVLLPAIFGLSQPTLGVIAVAHLGTLLAVSIYFRHDLWAILKAVWHGLQTRKPLGTSDARLGWYIVAGTVPVALAGLLLGSYFEEVFSSPTAVAFFLLVTAVLLIIGERMLSGAKQIAQMTWHDSLVIGLFQMLALLPGISRSGSTITAGLWRGLNREAAARFSFLLSFPAILGAGLLSLLDFAGTETINGQWVSLLATFLAAAVTGYICIAFLMNWLRKHSLYVFAVYCLLLGSGYLLFSYLQ